MLKNLHAHCSNCNAIIDAGYTGHLCGNFTDKRVFTLIQEFRLTQTESAAYYAPELERALAIMQNHGR